MDTSAARPTGRHHRVLSILALLCVAATLMPAPASGATHDARRVEAEVPQHGQWVWPLEPFRLERAFVAPAHDYGPGHRGIDLRPVGAPEVRAPEAGIVAFSGMVAGRGVLTIDHGDGLVTTLEPITSELAAGRAVARGQTVGTIATGGHAAPGALHFGVRRHGEYINPLLLVGDVPRAVLLPCC